MAHLARRLILLSAAAVCLPGCERGPGGAQRASFKGIDITGADYARELRLQDPAGRVRSLAEFSGRVVVVFFGFTQCPDVCPTTLLELAQVKKALGKDGPRVQGIFVTLDPERDTPEVLGAYVNNFGADFVGLRGSLDETKAVAKHFKVFFAKVPGKTEGSYSIDHTAGSYIFDPRGRVRLFTRYGTGAEALTQDIKALLSEPA